MSDNKSPGLMDSVKMLSFLLLSSPLLAFLLNRSQQLNDIMQKSKEFKP